jgi:hypothetical protein
MFQPLKGDPNVLRVFLFFVLFVQIGTEKWESRFFGSERLLPMKKLAQHLIAEVSGRQSKVEMIIGIDLGDVWSHDCTLNEAGEVVDRGRFRTSPKGIEKWFTDVSPARVPLRKAPLYFETAFAEVA